MVNDVVGLPGILADVVWIHAPLAAALLLSLVVKA